MEYNDEQENNNIWDRSSATTDTLKWDTGGPRGKDYNREAIWTDHHRILLQFLRVYRCGPGRFDAIELSDEY